ncbi:MAG TPA: hypothetical protein VFQ13_03425 [Anaerolineales bacterium]|nr:hypothetical protein [Anaerolineales bacterium]
MRKSTIFISAVLTTFALVMLYRIASAYTENKSVDQSSTEVVAEAPATLEPTATEPSVPTDVVLSPEEAAQLAAQVVGKTNLLSAETSSFNGLDAYMITFTNKDVVYVGLDGQILAVQVAPVVVNAAPPAKNKNKNNGGNQQTTRARSDDDDHDDHEDDD